MDTRIFEIRRGQNDQDLEEAAAILRGGGLVAFPTETVYGLGVSAGNLESVKQVFQAKGRSFFNPMAFHLPAFEMVTPYVKSVPEEAQALARKFLPGPLMLLLEKAENVPDLITAGSRKVGVRVPRNSLASALFRKAEVPVVATSANVSGRFSPTTVAHVIDELGGIIDAIVTGSDEEVLGIESTIIDVTTSPFRLTRSGFITHEQITKVLGYAPMLSDDDRFSKADKISRDMKIILVEGESEKVLRRMKTLIANLPQGSQVGLLITENSAAHIGNEPCTRVMGPRGNLEVIAKNFFSCLRSFEKENTKVVLVEGISREGIGWALMERLERMASEVIKVE
ncbi:MAG: L-threonylcarbamoyladenylate synthase [Candidatus Eremiobacteraeota bacterium]|nr:L-threonylcarbamoyladenylate synthase [Candidatus Eremiobacteraeota bacterium]